MKIQNISVFQVSVPLKEGTYTMSGGRALDAFDSTIVRVTTSDGVVGWGEYVPLGANYLPAYAEGARTGLNLVGRALIGEDPRNLTNINAVMDETLRGHPYVKSALDIACWDILGKVSGLPLSTLFGGKDGEDIRLYRSITQESPERMVEWVEQFRSQGFTRFQLKVGGNDVDLDIARIRAVMSRIQPGEVVVADANGGWVQADAIRILRAVGNEDFIVEQPCQTYEECLSIRSRIDNPFVLDESIDSVPVLMNAISQRAIDGINIKISKYGGLTKARLIRDICAANGIRMTIEDTACTGITASAVAHLSHSTPERLRFATSLANVKNAFSTAEGEPLTENGRSRASDRPGLGVEPRMEVLGDPIFSIS